MVDRLVILAIIIMVSPNVDCEKYIIVTFMTLIGCVADYVK